MVRRNTIMDGLIPYHHETPLPNGRESTRRSSLISLQSGTSPHLPSRSKGGRGKRKAEVAQKTTLCKADKAEPKRHIVGLLRIQYSRYSRASRPPEQGPL
jgi:hypothetical protein